MNVQRLRVRLHRMTLFQRLIILSAPILLSVLFLVSYVTQEAARSLEQRITQDRLSAAQVSVRTLDQILRRAVAELTFARELVGSHSTFGQVSAPDVLLDTLLDQGGGAFGVLALLDGDGNIAAGAARGAPVSASDLRALLSSARESRSSPAVLFSSVIASSVDGAPLVAIFVPIDDEARDQRAFLMGVMRPMETPLSQVLASSVALMQTGHADLLDSAGLVLASTEEHGLLTPGDHPAFYRAMMAGPEPVIRSVAHEEDPGYTRSDNHLMAYVPLTEAPWALGIGGSESETLAPVRQFQGRIYWLTGIVFTLAVVGGLLGSAKLVQPVHALSEAARRMAEGDLSSHVAIHEGGEIGDLAEDMDRMRVRLAASLEEIWELNQDLERRIAERTRELVTASAIAEKVTSFIQLQEVLDHTLASVAEATRQESLAIFLLDPEGRQLTLTAGRALRPPFALEETTVRPGECLCGQVAVTGEVAIVDDILTSPVIRRTACIVAGFRNVAAFPLPSRERVEGILAVFSPDPGALSEQDFHVVNLICRQIGIAIQNARLYAEVDEKGNRERELVGKLINAQEEERKRLARELHDETGQALTAIGLSLESLRLSLSPQAEGAAERLEATGQLAREALEELRKMILALRPSLLDDLGLVPAVRRYALQYLEPLGIAVNIEVDKMDKGIEPPLEILLFRVVQEAINNVARHSHAQNATIRFWEEGEEILVEIEDDGLGFQAGSPTRSDGSAGGLGLLGMQERGSLMGGHVAIRSEPGHGTHVLVRVPAKRSLGL